MQTRYNNSSVSRSVQGFGSIILTALLLILNTQSCFAWGRDGHRIIAAIAARELTPQASAQVAALLGAPAPISLLDVSDWADRIRRSRPETGPWHYVDIEIASNGYDRARDCADDNCIVAQIERDVAVLRDRSLNSAVRADALRFLVHFVGDLHQPLHCADNHDRGGNEISVVLGGYRTNMHAVWDTDVVWAIHGGTDNVARSLAASITPAEKAQWSRGTVEQWASESFRLARSEIYSRYRAAPDSGVPLILPSDYAEREAPVAAGQLTRAGVRLAVLLNKIFDGR